MHTEVWASLWQCVHHVWVWNIAALSWNYAVFYPLASVLLMELSEVKRFTSLLIYINKYITLCFVFCYRMSASCKRRCIPPRHKDADLTKGELVCVDRCVTKYMELHDSLGEMLAKLTQQDEKVMKEMQAKMTQGQKWYLMSLGI